MFKAGQGVFGKVRFTDGIMPDYSRPYLIVEACDEEIKVLNVSSLYGKEEKLLMPYNKKIFNFKPPFIKPSFVKLDSLCSVNSDEWCHLKLLDDGKTLDDTEFKEIKGKIKK